MIGGTVGGVAHSLLPAITANPGAYALVGMGAAFAGIVRTPLTSVIMIFEMTRDYSIIVPLMIANLISFFISRTLQHEPIYEALALQEGVYLPTAELHEEFAGISVSEIADREAELLPSDATIEDAKAFLTKKDCTSWPVGLGRIVKGVVVGRQIDFAPPQTASLNDLIPEGADFPYAHMDHSASQVLERMHSRGVDCMPVVSRVDIHELLAVVTFRAILAAYRIEAMDEKAGAR
jgi:CIC family chloride channel protein